MSKITILFLAVLGGLFLLFGIFYIVGAIRTKEKAPAYIGIALIVVSIMCIYFLAF